MAQINPKVTLSTIPKVNNQNTTQNFPAQILSSPSENTGLQNAIYQSSPQKGGRPADMIDGDSTDVSRADGL